MRFSTAPQFAVISPYRTQFMVCRCCSRFFGNFITHTLHAALKRYTDIAVSVFNDFGHGFAVFGAFCCGFAVLLSPNVPLSTGLSGGCLKKVGLTKHMAHN